MDGALVTDQMVEMSKNPEKIGTSKKIMAGVTGDEGELFAKSAVPWPLRGDLNETLYKLAATALWKININDDPANRLVNEIYPWDLDCPRLRENDSLCNGMDAANSAVREYIFTCPNVLSLKNAIKNDGGYANRQNDFYFWYLDEPYPWVPPNFISSAPDGGGYGRCDIMACHGADFVYFYQADMIYSNIHVTEKQKLLSRKFGAYISNFINNGDPNNSSKKTSNQFTQIFEDLELPSWKNFNPDNWGYMRFNSTTIEGTAQFQDGDDVKVIRPDRNGQPYVVTDQKIGCELWDELDRYGKV